MKILGLGIDYSTLAPLFTPFEEETFAGRIHESLDRRMDEVARFGRLGLKGESFRGEVERQVVDLGDPRTAGWTYLVNGHDPRLDALVSALRPLAEHRGMAKPEFPLTFHHEPPEDWFNWLIENYSPLAQGHVPHYILIVGGPEQVPFRFQSLLDTAAAVGRVDFETLDELVVYVQKVIRLETRPSPVVSREAVVFAPDGGPRDATFFSHRYLAQPLSEEIDRALGIPTRALLGDEATKAGLVDVFRQARPALVFTASHGMVAPGRSLDLQEKVHGAICCQRAFGTSVGDWLFSADDVPGDEAFLEGSVFFQFACFGYGTPAESDYAHWRLGDLALTAEKDFTAALPRRLLAHPDGPVGYLGHVDAAWLHGFDDPESPFILDRWHPRISPFVTAVRQLLSAQPIGLALGDMHRRYNVTNAILTDVYDRDRRGKIQWTREMKARLASTFITRSDAQNYMVFGDPGARLRIPDTA
jgi:hypothetical protein